MSIKFNINEFVVVRPTASGLKILDDKRLELRDFAPFQDFYGWHRPDKDGNLKIQAWEMMSIFGESMGNGIAPPIDLEIEIITPEAP